MTESADVVVVGAGLAGLTAARKLLDAGASVRVLEARDRVGGRTFSQPIGKAVFDRGGQWIGPTQTRVAALARELGVETFATYTTGRKLVELGPVRTSYEGAIPSLPLLSLIGLHRTLSRVERLRHQVSPVTPHTAARALEWDGETVESWKRRHVRCAAARDSLDVAVRVVFGVEPSEISVLRFLAYVSQAGGLMPLIETKNGAQETRLAGGTQQLSKGLAARLSDRVVLDAPVLSVEQTATEALVVTRSGGVRARAVVVAVPPALASRIRYEPGLPAARDQLAQRMPMGATTKVFLLYGEAFWRTAGLSGEAISTEGPATCWFDTTSQDGAQPALVGFVVGRAALDFAARSERERREAIVGQAVRLFGEGARSPLEVAEQDWQREIWTRGCPVGNFTPGSLVALGPALREPVGRIHWAGTETATVWAGYMEGALESGERVAREVAGVLGLGGSPRDGSADLFRFVS